MLNPNVLIGEPLNFRKNVWVYPPKVKDIITNPNFNMFYKLLTTTQEDIVDELKKKDAKIETFPSPFEYLLLSSQHIQGFSKLLQGAFDFFCRTETSFLFDDKKIVFGDLAKIKENGNVEDIYCLEEEEFFDFQNLLREACGDKPIPPPEPENPDEDPRIRKIKERARERDRIKAKQAEKKGGISFSTVLVAICCMGIGITPLNIGEMSYASVGEIMKMMQDKEKYDIDIRSLLAGADSKKVKPKYWIRNTNN